MLVCGILKGLNESFKQTFIGNGQKNEVKEVEFRDFKAIDPELFDKIKVTRLKSTSETGPRVSFVSNYLERTS